MKTLILIRHAKSSWKDTGLRDRERPLNKRGKRDAPAMGRQLSDAALLPDLIVSSPAVRAIKTARKIAKAIGYDRNRITIREEVYMGGVDSLLALIRGLDERAARVYLVGHNPDLTDLAIRLTGAGLDDIPTCGIAVLEFPCASWRECTATQGRLALLLRPEREPRPPA